MDMKRRYLFLLYDVLIPATAAAILFGVLSLWGCSSATKEIASTASEAARLADSADQDIEDAKATGEVGPAAEPFRQPSTGESTDNLEGSPPDSQENSGREGQDPVVGSAPLESGGVRVDSSGDRSSDILGRGDNLSEGGPLDRGSDPRPNKERRPLRSSSAETIHRPTAGDGSADSGEAGSGSPVRQGVQTGNEEGVKTTMEIILIITGWVLAAFFAGWIAHDIFGRSVKKDLASLADKIDKSNNNNDDFID